MTTPKTEIGEGAAARPLVELSTQDGYDRWAAVYDTDGNPLIALEEPLVDQLIGNARGLAVLDVGCGTGRHALRFASAGARVDAIDFSSGMLERAKAKAGSEAVRFHIHDLGKPLPFANQSFDVVVCGLVVDHIADLQGLFTEMGRVCRPKGKIVVSVMHPAMMLRGVQARFHDEATGAEIRPASQVHQISAYVLAAVKSDLEILHLSEHVVDERLASRMERARRYIGWPMLLMLAVQPRRFPLAQSVATRSTG